MAQASALTARKFQKTDVEAAFELVRRALLAEMPLPDYAILVPSSKAARVAKFTVEGKDYFAKVFLPRGFLDALKQMLRGSRAKCAAQAEKKLRAAGFATPAVLQTGHRGASSWMLSEAVPGMSLGVYGDSFLRAPLCTAGLQWKRTIIRALGALVGRLHAAGIAHGDLRLNNILIDVHAKEPRFYLIDNERNHHYRRLPPLAVRVKNLVQVSLLYPVLATRTDRRRFYLSYREQIPAESKTAQAALINRVEQQSQLRLASLAKKPYRPSRANPNQVSNVPD